MRRSLVASSLVCLVACAKAPERPTPSVDTGVAAPDVATAPDIAAVPDAVADVAAGAVTPSDVAIDAVPVDVAPADPTVVVTSSGPAPLPATAIKVTGFARPDAAIYVADGDYFLVSNINGKPFAKDDNGFISKVKRDGTIEALKWIDGASPDVELHSPRGMVVRDGVLYVADVDHVRRFALKTGAGQGAIKAFDPDVRFTDVAFRRDAIVASDSGHDDSGADNELGGIYGLGEEGAVLVQIGAPEHPNRIGNGNLDLATTGSSIASQGERFDLEAGQLEGIVVAAQARLHTLTLVTSRDKGALLEVVDQMRSPSDPNPAPLPLRLRTVFDGLAGPGDFALTPDRVVAIPLADVDTLVIAPLELTEIPMPAGWDELQQLVSRAFESGAELAALVDPKWGVYLDVQASMVGPLEMDLAPGEKPTEFPAGAWIPYAKIVGPWSGVVQYGIRDAVDLINTLADMGESTCSAASLTCDWHAHPTADHLQFARNAKGEIKLVGVLATDAPGPDEEELVRIHARFDKAIARKVKTPR